MSRFGNGLQLSYVLKIHLESPLCVRLCARYTEVVRHSARLGDKHNT